MDTNTKWILVILVIVGLVVLFYNKNEHTDVTVGNACTSKSQCKEDCVNGKCSKIKEGHGCTNEPLRNDACVAGLICAKKTGSGNQPTICRKP